MRQKSKCFMNINPSNLQDYTQNIYYSYSHLKRENQNIDKFSSMPRS